MLYVLGHRDFTTPGKCHQLLRLEGIPQLYRERARSARIKNCYKNVV